MSYMKKSYILLFLLACSCIAVSCGDGGKSLDEDSLPSTEAPVINAPEETSFFLLPDQDAFLSRLTWSKAKYIRNGVVDKGVEFSYKLLYGPVGSDLKSPLADAGNNLYYDIYVRDFKKIYEELHTEGDEAPVIVSLYVEASWNNTSVCSEGLSLTIYPPAVDIDPGDETDLGELSSVDPPVFVRPAQTEIRLTDSEQNAINLNWSAPVFHFGDKTGSISPLVYELEFDSANNSFARGVTVASTTLPSVGIPSRTIQEYIVKEWGGTPRNAYVTEFRVKATYGEGESKGIIYSDVLSITFIPYAAFTPNQLIWLIGDSNGWETTDMAKMWPLFKKSGYEDEGIYEFTGYIPANTYFKFLPQMSLGSYLAFCADPNREGGLILEEKESGAFWNQEAGFKCVTLDTKSMSWEMRDYDTSGSKEWASMGFIGTFTGWAADLQMQKVSAENTHLWVLEAEIGQSSESYHCGKFRAEGSWNNLWNNKLGDEWKTPFGTMIFTDSPDVNIFFGGQAASLYVAFNDLTGQYIVYHK